MILLLRRLPREVRVSLWMVLFLVTVRYVAEPLHARGSAQALLGALDALGFIVGFPGFALAGAVSRRAVEHTVGIQFAFAAASNFVMYASALHVVGKCRRVLPATRPTTKEPASPSRRAFFRRSADLAAGAVLGGGLGYSLLLEPARLRITRRSFAVHGLPASLDRLRIAQVSDVHHGPWFSLERVREVVRRTNALDPDLILLTGDYVYESPLYIEPAIAALSELRARIGIIGVLGNHDWWDRGVPMKRAFAYRGLRLIDNARVILRPNRSIATDGDEGLCLAGVGDLWEDIPDYSAALSGLPDSMPRLLLAHNPDCAEDPRFLASHYRVDLMISGHTHGGQVRLPVLGAPVVPSRFGQKYARGLVQGPVCPVLISCGIGLSGLPIRFGVPPEIVLLELKRA